MNTGLKKGSVPFIVIHMDLKKVLKSDNVGDIDVYPGDIVFIPLKNQPFPPRDVINSLLGLGGLIESIFDPKN